MIGSPVSDDTEETTDANAPFVPAFRIAIAGIIVTKIPAKSFPTSIIGNHVYSFAVLIVRDVNVQLT